MNIEMLMDFILMGHMTHSFLNVSPIIIMEDSQLDNFILIKKERVSAFVTQNLAYCMCVHICVHVSS